MNKVTYPDLVLSVTLASRGFAYVIFEGPQTPLDWGIVDTKGGQKNRQIKARIAKLLARYQPEALVLENIKRKQARRSDRLKRASLQLQHLADARGVDVTCYDRATIRQAFAPVGATTKVEIAEAIAMAIPAFTHRLPPKRKIWMSESRRQLLFDAASLGMTHQTIRVDAGPIKN